MYLISAFSIAGMLFYLIDNLWCLIIGKAVMGVAYGMLQTAGGRILEEYVPVHVYGTLMLAYMFTQTISMMVTVIIASGFIPTDPKELAISDFWRGYLVWPLPLTLLAMAMIFFFVKHEPPKYLITQGREEEALESVKMCYSHEEDEREILD
jgi:MFS family permease